MKNRWEVAREREWGWGERGEGRQGYKLPVMK